MPFDAPGTPYLLTPESVKRAEDEADTCRKCHQRVHVGRTMYQLFPGNHVELPSAVENICQGDDEHRLIGHIALPHADPAHRERHHQQGKPPRHHHLVSQRCVGSSFDGLHITVILDDHVVADGSQRLLHLFQRDALGIVFHQCSSGRQVH